MGVSFTFLGSLLVISTNPDLGYEGMVGAIIMGGIFEGIVGLSAKYWRRFLTPVVCGISLCCHCNWFIFVIGRNGFLGRSQWHRRFWSMVSFICWNVYSNRVSGFALFTKGCV